MKKSQLLVEIEALKATVFALQKRVAELEGERQPIEITIKNETEKPQPLNITVKGWENFRSLDLMFTPSEIEQMASAAIKRSMKRHGL